MTRRPKEPVVIYYDPHKPGDMQRQIQRARALEERLGENMVELAPRTNYFRPFLWAAGWAFAAGVALALASYPDSLRILWEGMLWAMR